MSHEHGLEPDVTSSDNDKPRGSQEITRRLLDAAAVVFGEKGFEKARVSDIARRCGLTTGAIYARWANKGELFLAVVNDVKPRRAVFVVNESQMPTSEKFEAIGANLLPTGPDELRDLMLEALVIARRHKTFSADVALSLQEEADVLSAMINEGKAADLVDQSLSTEAIVFCYQALSIGTHLVTRSGTSSQRAPSSDEWNTIVKRFLGSLIPSQSDVPPIDN